MITLPPLVAYLRVSTDRQAEDGYGLDVQTEAIKTWAKEQKRRIVAWYRDEGISGALLAREGWMDVEDAISGKRAGGVIVYKLDRLARDTMVQETLMQSVWKLGGEVYSTSSTETNLRDDPEDPSRKLIRTIMGAVNTYERDMIALRMRRGRRLKANRGGFAYGSPAFGQRSVNKQLVKDPTEQATLRRLVELHTQDFSTRQIAAALNAEGRTTKRGKQWTSAGVSDVLRRQATGRHRGKAMTP
ncbi:recombinase family protein [Micromonospora krabiensis]|uniref:Site-specific DNA recombinase n=1 Tax=Micromonospora krabiensis TaxID=307121 RepID=A0A1C3N4N4_9ACTN|nr:recombinase family protein [Micromonospora krabiensis]SBV27552.1 Site-specific DNA recombinase [Micromonospora krabiensis]